MVKLLKAVISIVILSTLGFIGYKYWLHQQSFPSTDDAYVSAHVIDISPEINGKIIATFVKNQQQIKAGNVLFKLNPKDYEIKLAQAQADLANTTKQISANKDAVSSAQAVITGRESQLQTQQRSTDRVKQLVKQKLLPEQKLDDSINQLKAASSALSEAKSNLANAKAALGDANAEIKTKQENIEQAKLNLSYTSVHAPADGHIENYSLRVGDTVNAYQAVFSIVEDNNFWISANFKETDIEKIKVGQDVAIKIDMYPNQKFHGKIMSISTGSGTSFSLLPPENASGNWVKVTQRFPVKISIENNNNYPLRIGASVIVTVDARHK